MTVQVDRRNAHIIYDENGFAVSELLPGTYKGGIRNYRCNLQSGKCYSPKLYRDKIVILMFGKGRGYITDTKDAFGVKDSSKEDADNFEDSDTPSARAKEERFAWGSTRTEMRPYPEGVAESVAKEEKEIEAPKKPENVEVAPKENEAEVSAE